MQIYERTSKDDNPKHKENFEQMTEL